MIFSFAISNAKEDPKYENVPVEMPEKVEDLLEATNLTWEEMREGTAFSIDKKERFLERLRDDKILENINVNLKTRKEIADYLNSLSKEKLIDLHYLRDEIRTELNVYAAVGSATISLMSSIGVLAMDHQAHHVESRSKRAKAFFKQGTKISAGVVVASMLIAAYAAFDGVLSDYGLGVDGGGDGDIKSQVTNYINSLTLEEAREVLVDIKNINEELKKETE